MKPIDLRIGNYIKYPLNVENKPLSVKGIVNNQIITEGFEGDVELFFPIALTEEWFLKLGFNKSWNGFEDGKSDYSFELKNNEATLLIDGLYTRTVIKYVHQLQNLCFELTGNELH